MAGNIKGITIEFNGDTSRLDSALRKINNETKSIDKELRAVDKALKFNPTSVELWRQKQDLLKAKISETKDKLDVLKQAQAKMDADGVDKNSEEYRKLSREIIVAENQVKNFEGQLRKIGNINLRATSEQVKELGSKLTTAGQAMRGVSMAAAAVTAAIGATVVKSGKWADDLNTMSKVYSISTSNLQKYSAAASLVDVDVETIAKSHVKLEKTMYSAANGSASASAAYQKLGVDVQNTDGTMRTSEEVFNDVITALGQMTDETERDALAQQLMGKAAAQLNPLIEDGGETYKNVSETLSKYGLDFIDQKTLDQANQFNDELDTIKAIGLVTFQSLGTQLAGYLAPALEKVVGWVGQLAQWLSTLSPQTLTIITTIAGVLAVLAPLLLGLGKLAFAISSIMNLMAVLGPILGGISAPILPIIAVIAALVAAGVLLYKNWDTIKAKAQELWAAVVEKFTALKEAVVNIWNSIKTAVTNAVMGMVQNQINKFNQLKTIVTTVWNAIKSKTVAVWNAVKTAITSPIQTAVNIVRTAINKIKSIINGAKLKLPRFKLPHFRIKGGKLPWGIGGKGTAPSISVDWYAKGGIFDAASIIGVGEKGPEAVVPLDTLWNKLDNIAEASAGGNIVVNVYGSDNMSVSELAAEVERRIIEAQKRRRLAWQ